MARTRKVKVILAAFISVIWCSGAVSGQYFAGKTLTLITGYGAGGGYSAYSQALAKYLGRHIPGNPSVVTQEMPGAGSLVAANYIYNAARSDGLTIGLVNMFNLYSNYMFKAVGVHYDLTKMTFIGNVRSGNSIFLVRRQSYPDLEAVEKARKPIHIGFATKGDGQYIFGLAMGTGLGVDLKPITGYGGGGGEIDLALARGEIDGRVANLNSYLISKPEWIKSGFVKILVQEGVFRSGGAFTRDPRIPDVPTIQEVFPKNAKVSDIVDFGSLADLLSGVYIAPPKTSPEELLTLRTSFIATLKDPDFLADARKFDLEITPMNSEEVEAIVHRALSAAPEVVESIRKLTQ
jgi:tripartite-type tricarboxylate transporter receptor subunit TctC